MTERQLLTPVRRERIDRMVANNATDNAMFKWLVQDGMTRHDAHLAIDHHVYGEPITCTPVCACPQCESDDPTPLADSLFCRECQDCAA